MHAESEPPGQPDGAGPGAGPGDGPGAPPSVEPISPNRILENVTDESGLFVSTSEGFPEVVAHVPRATPGVSFG